MKRFAENFFVVNKVILKGTLSDLFISYLSAIYLIFYYQVVFNPQKVLNDNIIPKHIAKYAKKCIHDKFRINC